MKSPSMMMLSNIRSQDFEMDMWWLWLRLLMGLQGQFICQSILFLYKHILPTLEVYIYIYIQTRWIVPLTISSENKLVLAEKSKPFMAFEIVLSKTCSKSYPHEHSDTVIP
jgi:hypothetical protein